MCSQRAREPEELQWTSLHWPVGARCRSAVVFLFPAVEASNYFSEADMPLSIACRGAALPEPMGEWSLQQQPAIY